MTTRRGTRSEEEEAYWTRASSRMEKSSSGVHDVLLTRSLVDPLTMASANSSVSGILDKKERRSVRESDDDGRIGWKMAAGRSCMAMMGVLIW